MPCQIKDIIRIMEKLAPPEHAESWDNVGLLVGSRMSPVRRIMVPLDVTAEGIRDVADYGWRYGIGHFRTLCSGTTSHESVNSTFTKFNQCITI